jgi:universal stress protein E
MIHAPAGGKMTNEGASAVPSKVLVATDLSARSDRAVERAVILAKQTGAALTILHVVDADLPSRITDRLRDDAGSLISDHLISLPNAYGGFADIKIVLGKDHSDIVDVARTVGAQLLVLGVHRNESREFFRGTTAERVIRSFDRPVLMVKTRPQAYYRRVIVGVDFSICSRRAIEFAARLIPDGEFHLVHAFEVPSKGPLSARNSRREVPTILHERMNQLVGADIAELKAILQATPFRLFQIIRPGSVRGVIQEQIDQLKPDLLVIGTHGRSGVAHAIWGSVAEDFLSRPPCDVLIVPTPTIPDLTA